MGHHHDHHGHSGHAGQHSRRDILRMGAASAAAPMLWLTLGGATSATADTSGYKALVCVYLAGGNNGFNMVVPTTNAGYQTYARTRSNLALPQAGLLGLSGRASDGYEYGFHPACTELRALFEDRHLAILGNVGTLVQPTSRAAARAASAPLPLQLFSHIDQQTEWWTSTPDRPDRTGWAGRIADLYATQGYRPRLSMNVTIGGPNYWQEGAQSAPYTLGTGGSPSLDILDMAGFRGGIRAQTAQALISQAAADPNLMVAEFAGVETSAQAKVGTVRNALSAAGDLATRFPDLQIGGNLGAQLHQVARVIKAQSQIGDSRQIFYVQMGGFDTHNSELDQQQALLRALSQNLDAFWRGMNEIGLQDNVTLFTASDFGRSLGSNGDGSDHAWGNHHLILGGAVRGGYYGTMPDLTLEGADDVGGGRVIPTTSTDQYAATLTRWFGVGDAALDTVLPNLHNFTRRDLGFLA